ncbi:MAG: hypothetical protein M1457_03665 [bacterium]|nr:hypothetical protein [bacterium]
MKQSAARVGRGFICQHGESFQWKPYDLSLKLSPGRVEICKKKNSCRRRYYMIYHEYPMNIIDILAFQCLANSPAPARRAAAVWEMAYPFPIRAAAMTRNLPSFAQSGAFGFRWLEVGNH